MRGIENESVSAHMDLLTPFAGFRISRSTSLRSSVCGPATGCSFDECIADHLDYLHHEAFFVVTPTFEVAAYRTLRFSLQRHRDD